MRKIILTVLLALGASAGCGPGEHIPATPVRPLTESQKYFASFKSEFLDRHCTSCHDSKKFQSNPKWIVPGRPDDSIVYQAVLEGSMPPKNFLDMETTDRLREWIAEWPSE